MLDGRFPYILAGKGERLALVLPGSEEILFGIRNFAWMFKRLYLPIFPPGYRVLIVGYGDIPEGKTAIDIAISIGKAVKGRFSPDVVLGLSFGGLVTLALGVVKPRLVKGLIIASAAHVISPGGLDMITDWMRRSRKGVSRALFYSFIDLFKRKRYAFWMKAGITIAWPFFKTRINPSMYLVRAYEPTLAIKDKVRDFLPAIEKPALVLGGSDDQLFPESGYRELASLLHHGVLDLVEGETHTVLFEQQRDCKRRIARFLEKIFSENGINAPPRD
ncbi:MAG: alpha/beta fold hydrolase [Candidatus Sigynarchaeota archaeon]